MAVSVLNQYFEPLSDYEDYFDIIHVEDIANYDTEEYEWIENELIDCDQRDKEGNRIAFPYLAEGLPYTYGKIKCVDARNTSFYGNEGYNYRDSSLLAVPCVNNTLRDKSRCKSLEETHAYID